MSDFKRACQIASKAHRDQLDKAGQEYIDHPRRVSMFLIKGMFGEAYASAAMLHDVVEDSNITFEDLEQEGFSDEIIHALKQLTKIKGETKMANAQRIVASGSRIALVVKIADLTDNMNLGRLHTVTVVDCNRWLEYLRVKSYLSEKFNERTNQGNPASNT